MMRNSMLHNAILAGVALIAAMPVQPAYMPGRNRDHSVPKRRNVSPVGPTKASGRNAKRKAAGKMMWRP
jgi:hypothetical protein